MKTAEPAYRTREEASAKKPQELYRFWIGETSWTYTSGDVAVDYMGRTYEPAPIERGSVVFNTELEISQLSITIEHAAEPVTKFIVQNPVDLVWVEVLRVFRDQSPLDVGVVFIGQVKNVSVKGLAARATCVGFESYLKQPVPIDRYGPQCNATLFDARCQVDPEDGYKLILASVAIEDGGFTIRHGDLEAADAGFFTMGYLEWGDHKRMIAEHVGERISVRFLIPGLVTGEDVTVYAGCDGGWVTCKEKFNNRPNFRGHPLIPLDNPVMLS